MAATARERFEQVSREYSDIRDHLPRLRAVARGTVLELGVRDGNSTTAFLAGLEEHGGTLWSVDVDPECRALFEGHPQWRFVQADSRDAATVAAAGLPEEIDVLFVDTLHTYEHVRSELEVWGDRVAPGGLLFVHDTDRFPQIRRAIGQWGRSQKVPFRYLGRSNGLCVAYPGRGRAYGALLAVGNGVHSIRETLAHGLASLARFSRRVARRLRRGLTSRT